MEIFVKSIYTSSDIYNGGILMKVKTIRNHILNSSEKELMEFIEVEFLPRRENSVEKLRNNYNTLTKLPADVANIGIARMKKIEEDNDVPKFAPVVATFLLAVLAAYSDFFGGVLSSILDKVLIKLVVFAGFFGFFTYLLSTAKLSKSKAMYFREIIESVKSKGSNQ